MPDTDTIFDIFVIGGGINGAGIFRDAAGRGYRVALAEKNDFASATSSASTKLFHGGLRYLEFFEFGLVRKALTEREVLLKAMPHISWPMRFVLPLSPKMRFESDTPTSRLLSWVAPWLKGRRPAWLIRFGLFLYDTMGGRALLPGTQTIDLSASPEGLPLKEEHSRAYVYSDCWVEDSRLTLLNIRDAADKGGTVFARTMVTSASQEDGLWTITLENSDGDKRICHAKLLVNAGGPWAQDVVQNVLRLNSRAGIRLVRGSHIVTRKLYDHDKCYFFQGTDGRIMFAIPYEEDFTLIGTTDCEHHDLEERPNCSAAEQAYMIDFANTYFATPIVAEDVIWSYSGVRPLFDEGSGSATAATRDYHLDVDKSAGAPLLSVFGGKITTYRKLSEEALAKIDNALGKTTADWTEKVHLPGGDFEVTARQDLIDALKVQLPFLNDFTIRRLFRQYGTQCKALFEGITAVDQLGLDFGCGVFSHEVDWAIENEWVRTADDFLWRRSKMGLRIDRNEAARLDDYIASKVKHLPTWEPSVVTKRIA